MTPNNKETFKFVISMILIAISSLALVYVLETFKN